MLHAAVCPFGDGLDLGPLAAMHQPDTESDGQSQNDQGACRNDGHHQGLRRVPPRGAAAALWLRERRLHRPFLGLNQSDGRLTKQGNLAGICQSVVLQRLLNLRITRHKRRPPDGHSDLLHPVSRQFRRTGSSRRVTGQLQLKVHVHRPWLHAGQCHVFNRHHILDARAKIRGDARVDYLDNETLDRLTRLVRHLVDVECREAQPAHQHGHGCASIGRWARGWCWGRGWLCGRRRGRSRGRCWCWCRCGGWGRCRRGGGGGHGRSRVCCRRWSSRFGRSCGRGCSRGWGCGWGWG
mmetsp:Transcript_32675/g.84677  ORF Transcript_32675/g.84677 Transcript_32675/m.84677 type:complete len:295 (-) Transcript_32675:238-1122(-)